MADAATETKVARLGRGILDRLPEMGVTVAAGILLCVSYPPFGWWYCAVVAFAVLAWVLLRESTSLLGGLGYGFLFGLAFYIPLLPWTGELVGTFPWLALAALQAVFPAAFGVAAVAVRRLRGWPIWFAALWVAAEWLKSSVPFGGFPWGVVAFGQTGGPMLPLVRLGGVDEDTVYLQHTTSGETVVLEGIDGVVLAQGHESVTSLASELDALDGVEVHAIGDCVSPRTVEEAVLEGLEVAAAL